MTDENIQFTSNTPPVLKGGTYLLEVTLQNLPADNLADQAKTIRRIFTVSGDQAASKETSFSISVDGGANIQAFSIPTDSQTIQAVFPPADSLGDHSDVLPHIILNRSSLPWEYRAIADRDEIPWLALLLFDENESPELKIKTLGKLSSEENLDVEAQSQGEATKKPPVFPEFEIKFGSDRDSKVTVIDVQKGLLERFLPSADDLKYLAHVRQGADSREVAVIVGNRLPKPGGASIIHLVSMEGRYKDDGEFDYQDATETNDLVRLVSLYRWRFACEDKQQNFTNLVLNLNPGTLRLPQNRNADAEKYLATGCAPLRHTTRQGSKTISWYHGPLLPKENTAPETSPLDHPIRASDALICFNPDLGLFDVSYAAAWELGRFLALQSKAFSTELFNWRRSHAQGVQSQTLAAPGRNLADLLLGGVPAAPLEVPSTIQTWFERLERLEGIPLNYLIPDEHMLPPESIRFFFLDQSWLECLQDGAFSLGRVLKRDEDLDVTLKKSLVSAPKKGQSPRPSVTGFLLRSNLVAGWPSLLVDGFTGDQPLSPLPMEHRLSKDILIYLFEGVLDTIELHLTPESMHFGVDGPDIVSTKVYVEKGSVSGDVDRAGTKIDIPWRDESLRAINITNLARKMNAATSAEFASQMIEPVEKVQFITKR